MKLRDILHADVITVHPDDSIDKAICLMEEHRIRHLPVVRNDGALTGMLSDRDLLEAVGWLLSAERRSVQPGAATAGPRCVGEIMSIPSLALGPDEQVESVGRLMLDKKISAVPVSAHGRLVGIVTVTDLLRCYLSERNEPRGPWRLEKVRQHMHSHLFTLGPEDRLTRAVALMQQKRIRHIPVMEGSTLVGMVSDHDVRRAVGLCRMESFTSGDRGAARELSLRQVMSSGIVTVAPDTSLAEVAACLLEHRFGAVLVAQAGQPIGIVTETDLLRAFTTACAA